MTFLRSMLIFCNNTICPPVCGNTHFLLRTLQGWHHASKNVEHVFFNRLIRRCDLHPDAHGSRARSPPRGCVFPTSVSLETKHIKLPRALEGHTHLEESSEAQMRTRTRARGARNLGWKKKAEMNVRMTADRGTERFNSAGIM